MPHRSLVLYLRSVEECVRGLGSVYVERYEEEFLGSERVNLRMRIRFQTGAMLEVNEALVASGSEIQHLGYRYHFQDATNTTVFRYDNTPHFPGIPTFPDHKHSLGEVVACGKPDLTEAIGEAQAWDAAHRLQDGP